MMFVFAYLANINGFKDWPVDLMHQTEMAFVGVALICFLIAVLLKRISEPLKAIVALVGGASAGLGSIMPFELAPFFFGSKGEVMMASVLLVLAYPVAIGMFAFLLRKLMNSPSSIG
jgi:thiosulfate dehydrogenase [quinone] large subunit